MLIFLGGAYSHRAPAWLGGHGQSIITNEHHMRLRPGTCGLTSNVEVWRKLHAELLLLSLPRTKCVMREYTEIGDRKTGSIVVVVFFCACAGECLGPATARDGAHDRQPNKTQPKWHDNDVRPAYCVWKWNHLSVNWHWPWAYHVRSGKQRQTAGGRGLAGSMCMRHFVCITRALVYKYAHVLVGLFFSDHGTQRK